VNPWSE